MIDDMALTNTSRGFFRSMRPDPIPRLKTRSIGQPWNSRKSYQWMPKRLNIKVRIRHILRLRISPTSKVFLIQIINHIYSLANEKTKVLQNLTTWSKILLVQREVWLWLKRDFTRLRSTKSQSTWPSSTSWAILVICWGLPPQSWIPKMSSEWWRWTRAHSGAWTCST